MIRICKCVGKSCKINIYIDFTNSLSNLNIFRMFVKLFMKNTSFV
ncbi:hypothetical protein HMPREF9446_00058 [Bacteroides fluxus YIT 12057]|uniref:Uncharacterized protein n=1 Tax=Bacteroides fluxus YIT 12057 TaxID=763034 RepID=F3PMX2_9BACE|nr:hypothetical protein HMPREF9446_00058 [Bacteroides fluxus YIT 12057]